jgi:hypothetical protein
MPSKLGSQDKAFHEDLETLLSSWPLPIQKMSGLAVFLRSFIIKEIKDLAALGGREPSLPLRMLIDALNGLNDGHDHPIFEPLRTSPKSRNRGRPPASARKLAAIRYCVRYRLSAEQGVIEDRNPMETISDAFGVDRRTVDRWFTKHRTDVGPLSAIPEELAKPLLAIAGDVYANTLKKLSD